MKHGKTISTGFLQQACKHILYFWILHNIWLPRQALVLINQLITKENIHKLCKQTEDYGKYQFGGNTNSTRTWLKTEVNIIDNQEHMKNTHLPALCTLGLINKMHRDEWCVLEMES